MICDELQALRQVQQVAGMQAGLKSCCLPSWSLATETGQWKRWPTVLVNVNPVQRARLRLVGGVR